MERLDELRVYLETEKIFSSPYDAKEGMIGHALGLRGAFHWIPEDVLQMRLCANILCP